MDLDRVHLIIRLGRYPFLLSGFLPFIAGAMLALLRGADCSFFQLALGYAIMGASHLSVHYSNDYFDAEADRFGRPTGVSGGSGVLVEHPELKPFAKKFAIALMGVSIALAAAFVYIFSFPAIFILFVVGANLLGWFYTAPPLKLAYRGLGEITNMITFGLLMPGMGYLVAMGWFDPSFFAFSIPFFLYGLVFITSVEMPDVEGDRLGGKPTLMVRKGYTFGFRLIALAASIATFAIIGMAVSGTFTPYLNFWPVVAISIIPLAAALWGILTPCIGGACVIRRVKNNIYAYFLFTGLISAYLLLIAAGV